jgi:hypothetical protein
MEARNLEVEDCAFNVKVFSDPCREIPKATKCVSVSRDQLPLARLDVSERPKAVDLQLEDVLIRIKGLHAAGKQYGT